MPHFLVLRSGRTYGVYVQPGTDGSAQELLEGGFFSKAAASDARDRWEAESVTHPVDISEWEADL